MAISAQGKGHLWLICCIVQQFTAHYLFSLDDFPFHSISLHWRILEFFLSSLTNSSFGGKLVRHRIRFGGRLVGWSFSLLQPPSGDNCPVVNVPVNAIQYREFITTKFTFICHCIYDMCFVITIIITVIVVVLVIFQFCNNHYSIKFHLFSGKLRRNINQFSSLDKSDQTSFSFFKIKLFFYRIFPRFVQFSTISFVKYCDIKNFLYKFTNKIFFFLLLIRK